MRGTSVVVGESSSQLKVMRQAATTAGLDIMMGVVERTKETLDTMSNIERLYEAARRVPAPSPVPAPVPAPVSVSLFASVSAVKAL
jgi:hypothetical protein